MMVQVPLWMLGTLISWLLFLLWEHYWLLRRYDPEAAKGMLIGWSVATVVMFLLGKYT